MGALLRFFTSTQSSAQVTETTLNAGLCATYEDALSACGTYSASDMQRAQSLNVVAQMFVFGGSADLRSQFASSLVQANNATATYEFLNSGSENTIAGMALLPIWALISLVSPPTLQNVQTRVDWLNYAFQTFGTQYSPACPQDYKYNPAKNDCEQTNTTPGCLSDNDCHYDWASATCHCTGTCYGSNVDQYCSYNSGTVTCNCNRISPGPQVITKALIPPVISQYDVNAGASTIGTVLNPLPVRGANFTCVSFTGSEYSQIVADSTGAVAKDICSRYPNTIFTNGNNANFSGCNTCVCCAQSSSSVPAQSSSFTGLIFFYIVPIGGAVIMLAIIMIGICMCRRKRKA